MNKFILICALLFGSVALAKEPVVEKGKQIFRMHQFLQSYKTIGVTISHLQKLSPNEQDQKYLIALAKNLPKNEKIKSIRWESPNKIFLGDNKKPLVLVKLEPLTFSYDHREWTPNLKKSLVENLRTLEKLNFFTEKIVHFLLPPALLPLADAASWEEQVLVGWHERLLTAGYVAPVFARADHCSGPPMTLACVIADVKTMAVDAYESLYPKESVPPQMPQRVRCRRDFADGKMIQIDYPDSKGVKIHFENGQPVNFDLYDGVLHSRYFLQWDQQTFKVTPDLQSVKNAVDHNSRSMLGTYVATTVRLCDNPELLARVMSAAQDVAVTGAQTRSVPAGVE